MPVGNLGVRPRRVLALGVASKQVVAAQAKGHPIRDVVRRIEGTDLTGMADDGLERGHADIS